MPSGPIDGHRGRRRSRGDHHGCSGLAPPGRRDPARCVGVPDGSTERRDVTQVAGRRALMVRAAGLRPSLDRPQPGDVGHLLGRSS